MVVIDKFIKYYHLMALSHSFSAATVAVVFLNSIHKLHGPPTKIITDRDPIFTSNFWKELMGKLEIKLNFTTAYHPQSDGQSERLNQCVESYLRCMVFQCPRKWHQWLALAEWWYNTNFHTAIKTTPFEALYGYPPPHLPMGTFPKGNLPAVNDLLVNRQRLVKELKEQLLKAQSRMKKYADLNRTERHFGVGDWVYLKLQPYRQISSKGKMENQKLSSKFYGPFEVLSKIGAVAYRLNLPPGSLIHPVFHVSQLKKRVGPSIPIQTKLPLVGPEGKLRIAPLAILKRRVTKKNNQPFVEVLVQWSNLPVEEASLEDYYALRDQFPDVSLEDKTNLKGKVLSAHHTLEFPPIGLVTVGQGFNLANDEMKGNNSTVGPEEKKGEEGSMGLPPIRAMGLNRSSMKASTGEKSTDRTGDV
jgi:hypothetical protein